MVISNLDLLLGKKILYKLQNKKVIYVGKLFKMFYLGQIGKFSDVIGDRIADFIFIHFIYGKFILLFCFILLGSAKYRTTIQNHFGTITQNR